jgi:uncharacterized protein
MSSLSELLLPASLSPGIALLLVSISFFTSALTAAFGIGGGIAMLGALAGSVPAPMVVAVHGVVQFGSNIGRAVLQRAHVLWRPVLIFTAGSIVGAALGAAVFVALPERALLGVLGGFILLMAWVPKPRIPGLDSVGMLAGGFIATFLTMFVGATGPFVQALLLPLGLGKRELIASHAACNVIQHGLKVVAFGWLGFQFGDWLPLMVAMIATGFLGTWFGTQILDRMPEALFRTVLKWLLTLLSLDLLRRAAGY